MMKTGTKIKIIIFEAAVVFACMSVVYWSYISAPRKNLYYIKDISMDAVTLNVFPVFKVFYRWNGEAGANPKWIIFKSTAAWKIAASKDTFRYNNLNAEAADSEDFGYSYIEEGNFGSELSRTEFLLDKLGFVPVYEREKETFFRILQEITDFEEK
ncbi:MAG: hypothetical protein PHO00_03565 [bacterium]|nr:hypothetical protein [bacterium]